MPIHRSELTARLELEQVFPELRTALWQLKSPIDFGYNCFAWAACDAENRWEPDPDWHWPIKFREYSVPCFVEGFASLGYKPCDNPKFEFGYQKVAIYVKPWCGIDEFPSHMARQQMFGRGWLSKLGNSEDIFHPRLEDLKGHIYGEPFKILKRNWWQAIIRRSTFLCAWRSLEFWRFRRRHPHGI